MLSFFRWMHYMPQSAIPTYFRTTIPANSYFDVLGFKRDTFENIKTLKTSIKDSLYFGKT